MELHDIQRLWDSAALGFNTGCSRPDMANGLEDGYLLLANVHCQVLASLVDAAISLEIRVWPGVGRGVLLRKLPML